MMEPTTQIPQITARELDETEGVLRLQLADMEKALEEATANVNGCLPMWFSAVYY